MDVYKINSFDEIAGGNPYVGRGIIIGTSVDGKHSVIAYFITGRSDNSRNRVFVKEGDDIIIRAYDESKLKDPALIIYYPVRMTEGALIVTNGDQTDTIRDFTVRGETFEDALRTREFEPDAPNFTPRISGIVEYSNGKAPYKLSILKSTDSRGSECSRYFYEYRGLPGLGHFIHTYITDGDPVPSFQGEPERVAVPDDIDELTDSVWKTLDADNKISLYVRYTSLDDGVYTDRLINKNGGQI